MVRGLNYERKYDFRRNSIEHRERDVKRTSNKLCSKEEAMVYIRIITMRGKCWHPQHERAVVTFMGIRVIRFSTRLIVHLLLTRDAGK